MAHFIQPNGQPADVADYAESAYFAGFHFQHIAARNEAARLARINRRAREASEGRQARLMYGHGRA